MMLKRTFILFIIWSFPFYGAFPYNFSFPPPVELVYFNADVQNSSVLLTFGTATETNNFGFDIERADSSMIWERIDFVPGSGTSNSPKNYSFEDTTLTSNGYYYYKLKQIDNDGAFSYSDEREVFVNFVTSVNNEDEVLTQYVLFQNYPNPFNPYTIIKYQLSSGSFVSLKIFDLLGNEITTLVNEEQLAGSYSALFDSGSLNYSFGSGIYFYRLIMGRQSLSKKMIYLK